MLNSLNFKYGILIAAFVSCLTMSCVLMYIDSKENVYEKERIFYSFSSESLLSNIQLGKSGIFTRVDNVPDRAPENAPTVFWKQENYLDIAQKLFMETWGKSFQQSSLYFLEFRAECSDIVQGTFTVAYLKFFEIIQENGEAEKRNEYQVFIDTSKEYARTGRVEYEPHLRNMETLDLQSDQFSVEEALEIAEENGGRQIRTDRNDACHIFADYIQENGTGWIISYYDNTEYSNLILKLQIDAQSGEVKRINQK